MIESVMIPKEGIKMRVNMMEMRSAMTEW
jgi:hypothetical protein